MSAPRQPEYYIRERACEALAAGLSVIPVLADGTKRSAVEWKLYQRERALI